MTLVEALRDPVKRRAVVADGVLLVESEVARRRGLSGLAVKAGFQVVKATRPGVVAAALESLLPEFAPVLDPYLAAARASGDAFTYLSAHADSIADALLAVTDRKAKLSSHRGLKQAYGGLRGTARREVAQSVPGLARLVEKHLG